MRKMINNGVRRTFDNFDQRAATDKRQGDHKH
jgi:hypothetical protein